MPGYEDQRLMTSVASPRRISLVYFDAGGGHRSAAMALAQVLAEAHPRWQVDLVQLMELLDARGTVLRLTGCRPEDYYNKRLSAGWTFGLAQELRLLQGVIRLAHPSLVRRLQRHWLQTKPDLVVSLVPNFNRALADSVALAQANTPFVTVMTDLADYPPNFWIEPGTEQHIVCGTQRAAQQAIEAGCARHRVHRVSGMLLRPEFYRPSPPGIGGERARVGLPAKAPVGMVMFGGQGSKAMVSIARQLSDQPMILMCGRNESLAREIEALPKRAPRVVLGFTPDVVHWMRLADWFVGKPGPGSLSEAVHMGLPVVTVRNKWTMPQERYNTQWVTEQGLGTVTPNFDEIRPAVLELLTRLPGFHDNVSAHSNRALFELPVLLERIAAGPASTLAQVSITQTSPVAWDSTFHPGDRQPQA